MSRCWVSSPVVCPHCRRASGIRGCATDLSSAVDGQHRRQHRFYESANVAPLWRREVHHAPPYWSPFEDEASNSAPPHQWSSVLLWSWTCGASLSYLFQSIPSNTAKRNRIDF